MKIFDKSYIVEQIKKVCALYDCMNPQESEIEIIKVSYHPTINEIWIKLEWTNYINETRNFRLIYEIEGNTTQFEDITK